MRIELKKQNYIEKYIINLKNKIEESNMRCSYAIVREYFLI